VLRMCDAAGAGSIREFDDRFPMTQSLFNWCQDLETALQNGGEHDPELRTARLEMAAEWLRRFPAEDALTTGNFRRALADSYSETGHQQKADELYQSWLDDNPAWGWGWIGWADCYAPGEFAYRAVTPEGLDEIAEDPAGEIRFLLNASDVMGGVCGTAVEKSDLSVEVTPRETGPDSSGSGILPVE